MADAPPVEPSVSPGKEIKSLTGLRGVAASIVMFYHFFLKDHQSPMMIDRGYLAVDLFFVLSGFVMALSYGPMFGRHFSRRNFELFLGKRIARVYPLFLFVTLFATARYFLNWSGMSHLYYPGFGKGDIVANLLMIQSWGFNFLSMPAATWSISTEFFAYLLFPLLIFVALSPRAILPALLFTAGTVGIAVCAVSGDGSQGPLDITTRDSFFPLLRCVSGFCLGLVAYRAASLPACGRCLGSSCATIGVLLVFCALLIFHAHDVAIVLLFPFMVVTLYYSNAAAKNIMANKVSYFLGVISYSMYLIHPQIAPSSKKLDHLLMSHWGTSGHAMALAAYVAAAILGSYLCYRFVENPGRRFLKKLTERSVEKP